MNERKEYILQSAIPSKELQGAYITLCIILFTSIFSLIHIIMTEIDNWLLK